jgi:hypothetical protein
MHIQKHELCQVSTLVLLSFQKSNHLRKLRKIIHVNVTQSFVPEFGKKLSLILFFKRQQR